MITNVLPRLFNESQRTTTAMRI